MRIADQEPRLVPEGTEVREVLPPVPDPAYPWMGALVNNDLVSLTFPLAVNSTIQPLNAKHPEGWRIYRNSLCFLLCKAVYDVLPGARFSIEHAIGPGVYCDLETNDLPMEEACKKIRQHMHEMVKRGLPIERQRMAFTEAVETFEKNEAIEKLHLLQYRNPPHIVMYRCEEYCDLAHNPVTPDTSQLGCFELVPYPPGFILQMPTWQAPDQVPPFQDQPHLFRIFEEHKNWGRSLGVTTAGDLNRMIYNGDEEQFIFTAEALHEKKLAQIADRITERTEPIRVILIAGPSSAGKTTFAKRLSIHLRVHGYKPITLGTDDYFVGDGKNPIDANGQPDFEHIEAVDLEGFNKDLLALIDGKTIPIRRFDFATKHPVFQKETIQLHQDQVLLIEGIHGLNPRLTEMIPANQKFKIYVNAFTQLNVDSHNRISTTDNRLIRRMVRDHQFRGHSPLKTISMWPMVRRGEQRWIFPFEQEADATFNSALDYELAVLKAFAEPLLMQVKPFHPEYAESRRLTEFLMNFIPIQEDLVPKDSLLREYIGGSALRY
ncbi:MAG: nucleoside kinase [Kiritimatiellia bacterium]